MKMQVLQTYRTGTQVN